MEVIDRIRKKMRKRLSDRILAISGDEMIKAAMQIEEVKEFALR